MRNVTKQDVKNVAELLLNINGKTTTLEVKKELKDCDFFVKQNEISVFMDELAEEESWEYSFNGTFRTYSLKDLKEATEEDDEEDDYIEDDLDEDENDEDDNNCSCNNCKSNNSTKGYTNRNGQYIEPLDENKLPESYWRLSSPLKKEIFYFSDSLTRDQARCAYYKLTGLPKNAKYQGVFIND